MASNTPEIDRSISIDGSSECDSSPGNAGDEIVWSESQMCADTEISRLKAESTHRLQTRWDEIIKKYSCIDDEKESDEIDLHTGRIIVDNGHLSSIAGQGEQIDGLGTVPNIWAPENDLEREERRRKHIDKARRRLKANVRLYNGHIFDVDSGSESSEDNLSLFNSSPTKKHRSDNSRKVSLTGHQDMQGRQIHHVSLTSPSFGHRLSTPNSSPLKQKLPSLHSSPHENLSSDCPLSSPTRSSPENPRRFLDVRRLSHEDNAQQNTHTIVKRPQMIHLNTSDQNDTEETHEYEESFSMLELCENTSISYFSCAFHGCRFTSGSKASYRAHLLENHSPELQRIGYPVRCKKKHKYAIPGDTIPRLNLHFPLKPELPAGRPYTCGAKLAGGTCRKIFIDRDYLSNHRKKSPDLCSAKRQVFPCPLLGCDFMTDTSYEDFYEHVQGHHEDKSPSKSIIKKAIYGESLMESPFNDRRGLTIIDSEFDTSEESSASRAEEILSFNRETPVPEKRISPRAIPPQTKHLSTTLELTQYSPIPKLAAVPKLEILDFPNCQDTDTEAKTREQGYSSIDELFNDD